MCGWVFHRGGVRGVEFVWIHVLEPLVKSTFDQVDMYIFTPLDSDDIGG